MIIAMGTLMRSRLEVERARGVRLAPGPFNLSSYCRSRSGTGGRRRTASFEKGAARELEDVFEAAARGRGAYGQREPVR